jgi:hypothetical protein
MKIVHQFALFQNPYKTLAWQVWRGQDLLAAFSTRAKARAYVAEKSAA